MIEQRPNVDQIMGQLKDFQRSTVEYVSDKLYGPTDARRFLIADEVGLGKTMVARGIVAESINRLWDTTERIDIIYVCSNAQIAAQNLNRLNPLPEAPHQLASRITLLPLHLSDLADRKVNLIAFTPDTSLRQGNRSGSVLERALLHHLLRLTWGGWVTQREGAWEVMRGAAQMVNYRARFDSINLKQVAPAVLEQFPSRLRMRPDLEEEFRRLSDGRRWRSDRPLSRDRNRLIGALRGILAEACIEMLEPDLVILDEFQRFTDLLNPGTDAGQLASDLFNYQRNKVLLLSATPYRMFTTAAEDGASHYEDFLKTYGFLAEHDERKTQGLKEDLAALRRGIMTGAPIADLAAASASVEDRLRQVMVRTERLGSSADRNGMLTTAPVPDLVPTTQDVVSFAEADALSRHLGAPSIVELWKSAPYLLNFMEDYKFSKGFRDQLEVGDPRLVESIGSGRGLLPVGATGRYDVIDLGHAKVRALVRRLDEHHAFDLLWVPPAMPTTELGGVFAQEGARTFTKMLLFSAWGVAPRAISALLSYEAERRHIGPLGKAYSERRDISSPLDLRVDRDSLPVSNLLLTMPLPAFARLMDPIEYARSHGLALPLSLADLKRSAAEQLERRLQPWLAGAADEGRVDQRWYWVAPLLLKETSDDVLLEGLRVAVSGGQSDEESTPHEVLRRALDVVALVRNGDEVMGRPPSDLLDALVSLGLGGPANAWWRSLTQVTKAHGGELEADRVASATQLARRIISIFNQPESQQIVRSQGPNAPYWRQVLDYCVDGGLPAVIDEFAHLLVDQVGLNGKSKEQILEGLTRVAAESTGLRVSSVGVYEYNRGETTHTVSTQALRLHFAARIGQEREDEKGVERAINVREAFNSPFWPFVLVSTSIGQEGLDFHPYCHAIGHWNLPTNPVDLEQREGRVHRYKGHAVRKNVATVYGEDGRIVEEGDAWHSAFELARQDRPAGATDLVPYWVYPIEGGAKIERHTFPMPLSRDIQRLSELLRALTTYRMAIGQPRQEDLVKFLEDWYSDQERELVADALRVDLSPPT